MSIVQPPRALRVLLLPDRLVLHDVTYAVRGRPYTDRNALVDVVNMVHTKAQNRAFTPTPDRLIDVSPAPPPAAPLTPGHSPTPQPAPDKHRYLVFPFAPGAVPYEAFGPQDAGVLRDGDILNVEAAAGFLGVLKLASGNYCVLASNMKHTGVLPAGPVLAITKVKLIRLVGGGMSKEDKEFAAPIAKVLESGNVYFSPVVDLTRHHQRQASESPSAFWWTWPLAENAGPTSSRWALRTVYGFVGSHLMRFASDAMPTGSGEFHYTIISRRSRRRAGTRYITRGVDALGDVANFVETEQVVWIPSRPSMYSSFVIIRGSVPVFWRQNNGIARPSPELDSDIPASRDAFRKHFTEVIRSYGEVAVVSLVDKLGSEGVLADAFERHFELDLQGKSAKLVAFDFHRHCAGKEYERGLAALLSRIRDDIRRYSFFTGGMVQYGHSERQNGVFRVNCVDCLDRTNVVQSIIGRVALTRQLSVLFKPEMRSGVNLERAFRLYSDSEDRFKHVWGDNADAVSKQYSGTGALKTDFTRTGKRSTTGVIGDGVKSVMRMYYKNFVDEGRQESIDLLTGTASIQPLASTHTNGSGSSDLLLDGLEAVKTPAVWYKFQAQRVNAGGDRQDVAIELGDRFMYLSTPEGVRVEYPRDKMQSWERTEDGRPSDRRFGVRLRLMFYPVTECPATASPLDLMFKGGTIARETFLRAILMWAKPKVLSGFGVKPLRLRCFAGLNVGEHRCKHWGLGAEASREVLAIAIPETFGCTRAAGLAAAPVDIDSSPYVLVFATAVPNGGPAIAILASRDVAPTVMAVHQAIHKPLGQGCGVAVSMMVAGTSVCFASLNVDGPEDLFRALSSLRMRNSSFDITNQFHHVCIAGSMGDLKWAKEGVTGDRDSRQWVHLNDGAAVFTLPNGLSVMRNSFPGVRWDDQINVESFWHERVNPLNNKPSPRCLISDGITNGRPPPSVPKSMTQYVATLSQLAGIDLKTPPNVDTNTPMITYLNIYSALSSAEAYGTRPNPRPSTNPTWSEQLRIVFLPADRADVAASFLVGQILIATPLSDTIVAGAFVIPVSVAGETGSSFDVPVRLSGITTGRVTGFLHVVPLNEGVETASTPDSRRISAEARLAAAAAQRPRSPIGRKNKHGSPRRPPAVEKKSTTAIQLPPAHPAPVQEDLPRSSASSWSSVSNAALSSAQNLQQRLASTDLDAARRKGTKQLKSMVSKFSSLMVSPSTGNPPPHASNQPIPPAWVSPQRPPASASVDNMLAGVTNANDPSSGVSMSRRAASSDVPRHFDNGKLSDRASSYDFFQ